MDLNFPQGLLIHAARGPPTRGVLEMKRKNKSNIETKNSKIDFPDIKERRPPFWIEIIIGMIISFVAGIASNEVYNIMVSHGSIEESASTIGPVCKYIWQATGTWLEAAAGR